MEYHNNIFNLMAEHGRVNSRVPPLSKYTHANIFVSQFKTIFTFATPRLRFLLKIQSILLITLSILIIPTLCNAASMDSENLLINKLIQSATTLPLPQRIEIMSSEFINVPYQFEPLGEGQSAQYNQEPVYRFDKFDCQTYVSTILALACAKNVQSFQHNINFIDYKNGYVSFINRNHFADADWAPQNIHNGFIKDINDQIAGNNIALATTYINRKTWLQNLPVTRIHIAQLTEQQRNLKLLQLHHLSQLVSNQQANIKYIPLSALFIAPTTVTQ